MKHGLRRIQDSVHGLMEFRDAENIIFQVLDTPELQRLRRIKQLGLASLVFPGSEHSRFVHSLGVAYVALRFGRHLRRVSLDSMPESIGVSDDVVRDLVLAALCHDIGHGPLGHVWERVVVGPEFTPEDRQAWVKCFELPEEFATFDNLNWHELATQALLHSKASTLSKTLNGIEAGLCDRVAGLLRGSYPLAFMPQLLSSDVDVDRADFVLRDTVNSGVKYGKYDLDWLVSTLSFGIEKTDYKGRPVWGIGFDETKGLRVVEQFLVARRALYETVFYHKTVKCAEAMLVQFAKAIQKSPPTSYKDDDWLNPLIDMMCKKPISVQKLIHIDDYSVYALIKMLSTDIRATNAQRELAMRIINRDLFHQIDVTVAQISACRERFKPDYEKKICDTIKAATGFDDPDLFYFEEDLHFNMFSKQPSYFVKNGHLSPLKNDLGSLENLAMDEPHRYYVVREAAEAVRKLIVGS